MQEFFAQNLFSIIATVAAFGITFILKNISSSLQELREDYKALISTRDQTKLDMQKELTQIRELIAGQYVTKSELPLLIAGIEAGKK